MKRSNYIFLAKFAIEEVLERVVLSNTNARHKFVVNGMVYNPRVGVPRLQLFKMKGTRCVCCGLEAVEFRLQFNKRQSAKQPHLGLWAHAPCGDLRMFTIDHIVPKAKGGPNKFYNYQVMCHVCNREKGCKF